MALTKRDVDGLKYDPNKRTRAGKPALVQIAWDGKLEGFGCRVFPSGAKSFVLDYRNAGGRKRRITLGSFGALTVEQARTMAKDRLHAVEQGEDPLAQREQARLEEKRGVTVAAFAPIYVENARTRGNPGRKGRRPKKTWHEDEQRIARHILPAWGARKLADITKADVRRLHASITAPYEANRVLALVSIMFRAAADLGYLAEDHANPAQGVVLNVEQSRDRFVTETEMPRLMSAIADEESPYMRAAVLLYLLTGMRRSELCALQWSDVDLTARTLRLGVTKNGDPLYLPLSTPAVELLTEMPRMLGNPYVLPAETKPRAGWHVDMMTKRFARTRKRAGLEDVRLHDLRRTVGSWLSMHGASLSLIGAVLNHKAIATTTIYARFQTEAAREALEQHGARILAIEKH